MLELLLGENKMSKAHENAYNLERNERWELAKEGEKPAMQKIIALLLPSFPNIKYHRYDEFWFNFVEPEKESWVRGVSDFAVAFSESSGIFAEIKIKSKMFRKTKTGGTTQNGSIIPNYGCESAYLDKQPVFENVGKFLEMFSIPKSSFFFFFDSTETGKVYAISIAEIEELLSEGFDGVAIGMFGEGYGTKTEDGRAVCYLLPIDAMHVLGTNDKEYFEGKTTEKIIIPLDFLKLMHKKK